MDDFLAALKAKGSADLNAVMATLNEGRLCRETLEHWTKKGWVQVAPAMPLVALRGERFSRDLTLRTFCGEPSAEEPPASETDTRAAAQTQERGNDDHA